MDAQHDLKVEAFLFVTTLGADRTTLDAFEESVEALPNVLQPRRSVIRGRRGLRVVARQRVSVLSGLRDGLVATCVEPCAGCPTDERDSDEYQAESGVDHATAGEGSAHLAGGERAPDPKQRAEPENCDLTADVAQHGPSLRVAQANLLASEG